MFFKQRAGTAASLSYFFGCGTHGEAVVVDAIAGDEAWFMEQADEAKVRISHVIDTHIHADHLSGGRKLAQLAGAHYCLHESDRDLVRFNFEPLRDGMAIA